MLQDCEKVTEQADKAPCVETELEDFNGSKVGNLKEQPIVFQEEKPGNSITEQALSPEVMEKKQESHETNTSTPSLGEIGEKYDPINDDAQKVLSFSPLKPTVSETDRGPIARKLEFNPPTTQMQEHRIPSAPSSRRTSFSDTILKTPSTLEQKRRYSLVSAKFDSTQNTPFHSKFTTPLKGDGFQSKASSRKPSIADSSGSTDYASDPYNNRINYDSQPYSQQQSPPTGSSNFGIGLGTPMSQAYFYDPSQLNISGQGQFTPYLDSNSPSPYAYIPLASYAPYPGTPYVAAPGYGQELGPYPQMVGGSTGAMPLFMQSFPQYEVPYGGQVQAMAEEYGNSISGGVPGTVPPPRSRNRSSARGKARKDKRTAAGPKLSKGDLEASAEVAHSSGVESISNQSDKSDQPAKSTETTPASTPKGGLPKFALESGSPSQDLTQDLKAAMETPPILDSQGQVAEEYDWQDHYLDDEEYKYKTAICRSHLATGYCEYGPACQYAHGICELRPRDFDVKFKTELCKNYHALGMCWFGSRCRFIHDEYRIQAGENEFWLVAPSENLVRVEIVDPENTARQKLLQSLVSLPPRYFPKPWESGQAREQQESPSSSPTTVPPPQAFASQLPPSIPGNLPAQTMSQHSYAMNYPFQTSVIPMATPAPSTPGSQNYFPSMSYFPPNSQDTRNLSYSYAPPVSTSSYPAQSQPTIQQSYTPNQQMQYNPPQKDGPGSERGASGMAPLQERMNELSLLQLQSPVARTQLQLHRKFPLPGTSSLLLDPREGPKYSLFTTASTAQTRNRSEKRNRRSRRRNRSQPQSRRSSKGQIDTPETSSQQFLDSLKVDTLPLKSPVSLTPGSPMKTLTDDKSKYTDILPPTSLQSAVLPFQHTEKTHSPRHSISPLPPSLPSSPLARVAPQALGLPRSSPSSPALLPIQPPSSPLTLQKTIKPPSPKQEIGVQQDQPFSIFGLSSNPELGLQRRGSASMLSIEGGNLKQKSSSPLSPAANPYFPIHEQYQKAPESEVDKRKEVGGKLKKGWGRGGRGWGGRRNSKPQQAPGSPNFPALSSPATRFSSPRSQKFGDPNSRTSK